MLLGTALGSRQFFRTSPEPFQSAALVLLMGLGIAGLLRAIAQSTWPGAG